jgi:hypothetical protein
LVGEIAMMNQVLMFEPELVSAAEYGEVMEACPLEFFREKEAGN